MCTVLSPGATKPATVDVRAAVGKATSAKAPADAYKYF